MSDQIVPTVTVTPDSGTDSGLQVDLTVPSYEGPITFTMSVERDNDADWRVYLPSGRTLSDTITTLSNGVAVLNGIAYIGAPE